MVHLPNHSACAPQIAAWYNGAAAARPGEPHAAPPSRRNRSVSRCVARSAGATHAAGTRGVHGMGEPYAYLRRQIMPLAEAKIGVMTHAFNYGTACFEGIRGNWNAAHEQLYLFRVREHFRRLRDSAKILNMELPYTEEE